MTVIIIVMTAWLLAPYDLIITRIIMIIVDNNI